MLGVAVAPPRAERTSAKHRQNPEDNNLVYSNGVVNRYVWQIIVQSPNGINIPPIGFSLVDATTGEIVPNPP